jgi:hypothetical protein
MRYVYNSPPNWPKPPTASWRPPTGWRADPSWPSAPAGWQFWIPEANGQVTSPPPVTDPIPPVLPAASTAVEPPEHQARRLGARKRLRAAETQNADLASQLAEFRSELEKVRGLEQAARTEIAVLTTTVAELRGRDALEVEAELVKARDELMGVRCTAADEKKAADEALSFRTELVRREQARLDELRANVVRTEDIAMLQEAGIYEYRHRLADAVAYKARLAKLSDRYKTLARSGDAVASRTDWTVNGSSREGQKMVRETAKLMLRAYNAEADNCVRSMRPYRLASCVERLAKARETIARLGGTMKIRISDDYHRLRVQELELTSDHLAKLEEEKERARADRERQREEAALKREIEREKAKLAKEDAHWAGVQAKLEAAGNAEAAEEARAKRSEIADAMVDVEARAANVRTGHVYVISNIGAFGPDMVKVGMTRRLDPLERVRELGDASVPFRFDVHALVFSEDAVSLETRLHHELDALRVNRVNLRREFFHATPAQVREVLQRIDGQHLLEYTEEPEAVEWHASVNSRPKQPAA